MAAVEISNSSIEEVLEMPISFVLYLNCWKIDKNKWDEYQMNLWKKSH